MCLWCRMLCQRTCCEPSGSVRPFIRLVVCTCIVVSQYTFFLPICNIQTQLTKTMGMRPPRDENSSTPPSSRRSFNWHTGIQQCFSFSYLGAQNLDIPLVEPTDSTSSTILRTSISLLHLPSAHAEKLSDRSKIHFSCNLSKLSSSMMNPRYRQRPAIR